MSEIKVGDIVYLPCTVSVICDRTDLVRVEFRVPENPNTYLLTTIKGVFKTIEEIQTDPLQHSADALDLPQH